MNNGLVHVHRRGIGGGFRASGFADRILDFREALQHFVLFAQDVSSFINRDGALDAFYERLHPLLDYLLPQYLIEGKAHLVVAIGCTGGRHRSVAIADHLAARYRESKDFLIEVVHRDVERPI